jgi:hypothetical protein
MFLLSDALYSLLSVCRPSSLDLLVLTATVNNRREIMKLQRALEKEKHPGN